MLAIYAFDHELRRAPQIASKPLLAEIRLTWWSEVLDEIYGGAAVRLHPTAQALATAVERRGLTRPPLDAALDARLYTLEGDRVAGEAEAAQAVTEAAALALDPGVDRGACRILGAAWAAGAITPEARTAARRIAAPAFPAVAHVTLAGRTGSELAKRLRITWAVARGRI